MSTFTVAVIPLNTLEPDGYQRDYDPKRALEIADTFDAAQWDLPKVLDGEGVRDIIAGQHRVGAARILLAREEWPFETPAGFIQAQVVTLSDSTTPADLYLDDTENKAPTAAYFKHRAALGGKKDPRHQRAVDIQTALDRHELPLVRRQGALSGTSVGAISSLNELWSRADGNGAQVIDETLRLATIWPASDVYRFEGSLLGGLGLVARDLLAAEGTVARLEDAVRRTAALTVASKALAYATRQQSTGFGRPTLNRPGVYAEVFRSLLRGKPMTKPLPDFVSDLPYKAPHSTGRVHA